MFADYLAECGNRLLLRREAARSPFMKKLEEFLAERRGGGGSLRELAGEFNLSPCHFCKVFKTQTGLTFTEYRTRVRIERARQLLAGGQLRISEVAFEAGFNSIPHFNRVFRSYVGTAPSEFRRQAGTNGVNRIATNA
jgi:two-component system response regulator YesN